MIAPSRKSESFVDSNIWIYAFVKNPKTLEKTRIAADVLRQPKLCVSVQTENEVCRQLLRNGMAESKDVLLDASALRLELSISFWDSLVVASALSAGTTTLLTEDLQHNQIIRGKLRIKNPFVIA